MWAVCITGRFLVYSIQFIGMYRNGMPVKDDPNSDFLVYLLTGYL